MNTWAVQWGRRSGRGSPGTGLSRDWDRERQWCLYRTQLTSIQKGGTTQVHQASPWNAPISHLFNKYLLVEKIKVYWVDTYTCWSDNKCVLCARPCSRYWDPAANRTQNVSPSMELTFWCKEATNPSVYNSLVWSGKFYEENDKSTCIRFLVLL